MTPEHFVAKWRASQVKESAGAQEEVADVAALDGIEADVTALEELEADDLQPAAAAAGLPLVKLGNVMRRHVELSALASAQQAAGLELGRDEPLSAEPFLLRAVATAVSEMGGLEGQVALADLEGAEACLATGSGMAAAHAVVLAARSRAWDASLAAPRRGHGVGLAVASAAGAPPSSRAPRDRIASRSGIRM